MPGPDLKLNDYNSEQDSCSDSDTSDLESDTSELNIEPDIAQRTDMAEARAVSPAYPYGNEAMFSAEHVKVEPNLFFTVKLKGHDRTFVIPEKNPTNFFSIRFSQIFFYIFYRCFSINIGYMKKKAPLTAFYPLNKPYEYG